MILVKRKINLPRGDLLKGNQIFRTLTSKTLMTIYLLFISVRSENSNSALIVDISAESVNQNQFLLNPVYGNTLSCQMISDQLVCIQYYVLTEFDFGTEINWLGLTDCVQMYTLIQVHEHSGAGSGRRAAYERCSPVQRCQLGME